MALKKTWIGLECETDIPGIHIYLSLSWCSFNSNERDKYISILFRLGAIKIPKRDSYASFNEL